MVCWTVNVQLQGQRVKPKSHIKFARVFASEKSDIFATVLLSNQIFRHVALSRYTCHIPTLCIFISGFCFCFFLLFSFFVFVFVFLFCFCFIFFFYFCFCGFIFYFCFLFLCFCFLFLFLFLFFIYLFFVFCFCFLTSEVHLFSQHFGAVSYYSQPSFCLIHQTMRTARIQLQDIHITLSPHFTLSLTSVFVSRLSASVNSTDMSKIKFILQFFLLWCTKKV